MLNCPKILICTRFSFFGRSGWKSDFAADPEMLFEENRLRQRFWLFENITLPSLASQTSSDFHYYVLSSNLMPDWAKNQLDELCKTYVGEGRYTIRFAKFGRAKKFIRFILSDFAGNDPVAQVVLDDDDALSCDFVATLKSHLNEMDEFTEENTPRFVTFPVGYVLGLREEDTRIWRHGYKFINLGLTMIGTAAQKNIFAINHKSAPKIFGFTSDYEKPMYIRTLSNVNDSHAVVKSKWRIVDDWKNFEDIHQRFPFLLKPAFEIYHQLPRPSQQDDLLY